MVNRGEIKSVTTYIEPLGIYLDGSFALARVFDIVFQPVPTIEYISLKTVITKDGIDVQYKNQVQLLRKQIPEKRDDEG